MAPFYTRSGDDGYTGILGEGRLPKHHARMESLGAIDEAAAALGVARAVAASPETKLIILEVQRDLYQMMAEVASSPENAAQFRKINAARTEWLEEQGEKLNKLVEVPKDFIIAGDTQGGAALDLARTVVRRAERHLSALLLSGELENQELLRYLNRLSSVCFLLELLEIQSSGAPRPTLAKDPPLGH